VTQTCGRMVCFLSVFVMFCRFGEFLACLQD
jgi:hypothetical protein